MTKYRDYILITFGVIVIVLLAWPYVNKTKAVKNEINLIEEMRLLNKQHTDELIKQVDARLELLRVQDSILIDKIKSTNVRIKEIPARVNNLDRDQLYREISRF